MNARRFARPRHPSRPRALHLLMLALLGVPLGAAAQPGSAATRIAADRLQILQDERLAEAARLERLMYQRKAAAGLDTVAARALDLEVARTRASLEALDRELQSAAASSGPPAVPTTRVAAPTRPPAPARPVTPASAWWDVYHSSATPAQEQPVKASVANVSGRAAEPRSHP